MVNKDVLVDVFETISLFLEEHYEIYIVVISIVFIWLLCKWTIYDRIGEKGWKSLIPIYRHAVIFRAVGIRPILSLLLFVPLINIPVFIYFLIKLLNAYNRTYFFLIGLILLPPVFLCILAFGNGKTIHYQPHARYSDEPAPVPEVPLVQPTVIENTKTQETKKRELELRKRVAPTVQQPRKAETGIRRNTINQKVSSSPQNTTKSKASIRLVIHGDNEDKAPLKIDRKRIKHRPKPTSARISKAPRQNIAGRQAVQSRRNNRLIDFAPVPQENNPLLNRPEKKLISYGISIDMVKHKKHEQL